MHKTYLVPAFAVLAFLLYNSALKMMSLRTQSVGLTTDAQKAENATAYKNATINWAILLVAVLGLCMYAYSDYSRNDFAW